MTTCAAGFVNSHLRRPLLRSIAGLIGAASIVIAFTAFKEHRPIRTASLPR